MAGGNMAGMTLEGSATVLEGPAVAFDIELDGLLDGPASEALRTLVVESGTA
jgi:hypothetical protein